MNALQNSLLPLSVRAVPEVPTVLLKRKNITYLKSLKRVLGWNIFKQFQIETNLIDYNFE